MENIVKIYIDRYNCLINVNGDFDEIPDDKIDQLIEKANMFSGKFSNFNVVRLSPNNSKIFKLYDYMIGHPRLEELMKIEINYALAIDVGNEEVEQKFLECAGVVLMEKTGISGDDIEEFLDNRQNRKSARSNGAESHALSNS